MGSTTMNQDEFGDYMSDVEEAILATIRHKETSLEVGESYHLAVLNSPSIQKRRTFKQVCLLHFRRLKR